MQGLSTPPEGDLTVTLTMQRLRHAHATVTALPGHDDLVVVRFGTADQQVELLDDLPVVRQLLTDALTQLDAIDAGQVTEAAG